MMKLTNLRPSKFTDGDDNDNGHEEEEQYQLQLRQQLCTMTAAIISNMNVMEEMAVSPGSHLFAKQTFVLLWMLMLMLMLMRLWSGLLSVSVEFIVWWRILLSFDCSIATEDK